MHNEYKAHEAVINKIAKECGDVKTYNISLINKKEQLALEHRAGQFFMIGVPGVGEAPISISSSNRIKNSFDLTIRLAGKVTKALDKLKVKDKVTIRGPYGKGWPKINIDDEIVLIAGGIGLPAVKPVLDDYCHGYIHCKNLQLFYGTTHFDKLVCVRYYALWEKECDINMTLDNSDKRWHKQVGFITQAIADATISKAARVFIIGPPIMYRFVIAELVKKGVADRNIYLSLERKMSCGIGVCQHCACGDKYACKDGPVFRYDKIKDIPDVI
ncbi:MAG: FAD/NAD(P)-binding protein [Patescibacteria group bacterium]